MIILLMNLQQKKAQKVTKFIYNIWVNNLISI